ncbi:MAG: glycerol-3-phosphate 1-O-acyltransferase PlsY [Actinomycetota bacterium]
MSQAIVIPLVLLASYLLGSVSFGILVASARGVDIRSEGSGNPGTSNVLRVLGKKEALVVLLGDGLKGAAAAWLGSLAGDPWLGYVTLLAAVVGHTFPIWHGFKGGKSVATAVGGIMYLAPAVGVVLGLIWISMVAVWKTASIGSITVMVLLVPALWLAGRTGTELLWAAVIATFVLFRHAGNIQRLVTSSEQKVTK